jgi:hypothetical protein
MHCITVELSQARDSLYIPVDRGLWILLSLWGKEWEKREGK